MAATAVRLPALRLVLDLHERGLDPHQISAVTDLDPIRVAAVLEGSE